MTWGVCAGCAAKDHENAYLRELVESLRKENLALVDLKTVGAVFPRLKPATPVPEKEPEAAEGVHASPAQVREMIYRPPQKPEDVEELFRLQEKLEREGAS